MTSRYTVYISTILTDLGWETCTGRLLHLYTCTIRIILGVTSQYTVYISTILTDLGWETCTGRLLHLYDSYYIRGDVTVHCLHIHDINRSRLGDLHWSIVTFVHLYDSYYIRGDVTVHCLHIHDIN